MTASVPFARRLEAAGLGALRAESVRTLQVNVGKLCNQACKHCHVDAGPHRTEIMTRAVAERVVEVLRRHPDIETLDITGGAPELCPSFRFLVEEARALGRHVIDRCNLSVFFEPDQDHLPAFLRDHRVEVIASLPYYLREPVDRQRGAGAFDRSVDALRLLNRLGYGLEGTGLELNLVYNPVGAYLPPDQASIEAQFRSELLGRHGLVFNRLYTITNMPIRRFKAFLHATGNFDRYMAKLEGAFNAAAVPGVMCRTLVSVDWQGHLYDCDFNQMLDLSVAPGLPNDVRHFDAARLAGRTIAVGQHCYGCTAGAGSSCGGATVPCASAEDARAAG